MTEPSFDELLRRLVDAQVRFVLVGGLAVNAWGVVRGTKDVDIVVDRDPANLTTIAEVVAGANGMVQRADAIAGSRFSIAALLTGGERVLIDTDLGPLDVIQGLEGVPPYAELRSRAVGRGPGGRERRRRRRARPRPRPRPRCGGSRARDARACRP